MPLYANITLPDRPDPENIRRLDLTCIPMIRRMMRYGFRIDPPYFRDLSHKLTTRMSELRRDITSVIPSDTLDRFMEMTDPGDPDDEIESDTNGDIPPDTFNVESSAKIATLLYDTLHLDRTAGVKIKKTKGGERLSTGKKTLEQLKREHPVVPLILEYRENSKLESTYARTMPRRARLHLKGPDCILCGRRHYADEWRVHTQILTTRTASGRTASKNPNLANIPTRTKLGALIRNGFIASEGYRLSQRDFAQIELRLGADRSGDESMLRIYWADGDIHVDTAMRAFDKTEAEVTSKEGKLLYRAPCKNVNFAVFYLISEDGLLDLMAMTYATAGVQMPGYMTKQWCGGFISKWFTLYPGVKRFLDDEEAKARRYGIVWTAAGRVRRIPEVRSHHSYIQAAGVRQGCNHGIQGFSADIMKLSMGELEERLIQLEQYGVESYPLMTIYDELIIETPEDDADPVQAAQADVMDNVLVDKQSGKLLCRVPIKSDGKIMTRWTKE